MPSTANKGLTQPVYNTLVGTWGSEINSNLTGILDLNLGGVASIALSSSNYTLSSSEAQNFRLKLSGTLSANVVLSTGCIGFFVVDNNTTGSYTVTVQANFGAGAIGSGTVIPQGVRSWFVSDTTAGVQLAPSWLPSLLLAQSGGSPLQVRRTENDVTLRSAISVQSGSGSGNDFSLSVTGGGSNNVATLTEKIGSTAVRTVTSSAQGFPVPLDFSEISTPSAPAASTLRVYAKSGDVLAFQNSSGVERTFASLALPGALGLSITNNAVAQVSITAAQAILTNTSGAPYFYSGGTITINLAASGANGLDTGTKTVSTWYHLYLISNGSTVAGLASISSTSPTLPSGYTYYVRVGAMPTKSSGNLYPVQINGARAKYLITGSNEFDFSISDDNRSWVAYQVTGNGYACPTPATEAEVTITSYGSGLYSAVAPNANYSSPYGGSYNPAAPLGAYGLVTVGQTDSVQLESNSLYYWGNSLSPFAQIIGWRDAVACF